jgi:hypothetical protein
MTTHQEDKFREREECEARESSRRPEEWGAIPGAELALGPLRSVCCGGEPLSGIWIMDGKRTGLCSICWRHMEFREAIKP